MKFQEIEKMEKIILQKFGFGKNIIVLIPSSESNSDSNSEFSYESKDRPSMATFNCLKYEKEYEDDVITKMKEQIKTTLTIGRILRFQKLHIRFCEISV